MPRTWSVFFGGIAMIIVTTMMAPRIFGFQQFGQWGGMYSDFWCRAYVRADAAKTAIDPIADEGRADTFLSGDGRNSRIVWYATMHNEETCASWVRSLCHSKELKHTWNVRSAFAYYRGKYLMRGLNICDQPYRPSFRWFVD